MLPQTSRILHSPVNIGNQPWSLSRAERRRGYESDVVVNYGTWVGYPVDKTLTSGHGSRDPEDMRRREDFGATAAFRYDIFHYYFGRSLMYWDDLPDLNKLPFHDLHMAKKLGKKVFMTLQGCDVRLAEESNKRYKETMCGEGRCGAYKVCLSELDAQRRELVRDILPLCDKVFYLNPELGHYVPNGEFLPYLTHGDLSEFELIEPRRNRPLKIVHAPSDPAIKGTDEILAALDSLRSTHEFELILVKGKSHDEAMEIYKDADFAIDQMRAGWYGAFAVELMAMGKPVMASIRESDLGFIPPEMAAEIPILRLRPDHLAEDIATAIENADQLPELGLKSRTYVQRWHNPDVTAAAFFEVYEDPTRKFDIFKQLSAQV
jgi:hypothetical protein